MVASDALNDYDLQATLFGTYLLGTAPNTAARALFVHGMTARPGEFSERDRTLLRYIIAHPWAIGLIDGGLALTDPHSEVRRRLYLMTAVLEANPSYSDRFLPQQRNPLYLFVIGLHGILAVLKAVCGLALIKVVA